MEKILDRFLRYVAIDTMSDPDSPTQPSTNKQYNLLTLLCEELRQMGVEDVTVDKYGYLMATIPSNIDKDVPAVGFIAHVDSSPDASGTDIKPQIFENYDGGDIVINKDKGMKLSPSEFPELRKYIGQTIVTTDGTTLLGADDKAGVEPSKKHQITTAVRPVRLSDRDAAMGAALPQVCTSISG